MHHRAKYITLKREKSNIWPEGLPKTISDEPHSEKKTKTEVLGHVRNLVCPLVYSEGDRVTLFTAAAGTTSLKAGAGIAGSNHYYFI